MILILGTMRGNCHNKSIPWKVTKEKCTRKIFQDVIFNPIWKNC